ncbi:MULTISPECIES: META domain-containing protein [unclassified Neisseria]|uniref:META domain-containing protein n=1 Tax=unclassified Neisseria TaxID=2623750 RepID=UPI0026670440|nr:MULTISPECIES: META domain-containing protein [unclassified Neisseria]MDO1509809.1 META domain-containing protein [Neisseria sp. MVDL19-042950]MDO1515867.1 META domain-containing protein [Neisseria sp. MVDL18-041461]MDO1562980.1 META domain-containing protein [Neisseria sp. MVDL20-010259]
MKLVTLLPALALSGCIVFPIPVPEKPSVPQQIYGKWQITELNSQAVRKPDAVLTLNSSDSSFHARTDCNNLFGQYSATADKKLHFKDVASTLKSCPDRRIEELLGSVLPKVDSYRFNNRHIEMLDKQGRVVLQGQRPSAE